MNPIKSFAIFKNNKKEKEAHPDYTISAKVGEEYVTIGGAWIKEGKSGKFFSCKLSNTYEKRKGYGLVEDVTAEELELAKHDAKDIDSSSIPF